MNAHSNGAAIETAAVTDRGLSEKRPHNEDSYLLDAERRIFVVADGVGGAHAGEVASKTAVEVLDEAFRHQQPGEDVEDLMEIAVQRANASIYQLSREQKQFSMMATTVVVLHLDGGRATIGHVGDSRIYRLDPAGRLHRETEDHSVVEEEVRAGRMTAEQAATHPSRNVISRALGAEAAVEVDLKTIEVEDGTTFLLCSDGITRHLPDAELSAILRDSDELEAACAEMKRRCFERGAEDNLTAVLVRLGARASRVQEVAAVAPHGDDEATLVGGVRARPAAAAPAAVAAASGVAAAGATTASPTAPTPLDEKNAGDASTASRRSRISGELADGAEPAPRPEVERAAEVRPSAVGRAGSWLGTLLLLLLVGAGAFYAGMMYDQTPAAPAGATDANSNAAPTPAPTPLNGYAEYIRLREQVDGAPALEASRMASEHGGRPLEASDPVFLALYGRALLLSGQNEGAMQALRLANQKIDGGAVPVRDTVKIDARLGLAAAAVKDGRAEATGEAAQSLANIIESAPPGGAAPPGGSATPAQSSAPPATPFN
jgi:protein phosphatase